MVAHDCHLGASVLIPESYVAGPQCPHVALPAARRDRDARTRSTASPPNCIDRFGPLPDEVEHLFEIVAIKQLCQGVAGVEKIDAGPKGGTIAFRGNAFANPHRAGEVHRRATAGTMKVRTPTRRSW